MQPTTDATGLPSIVAATSAVLSWQHRRGGTAHCLLQLRTLDTSHDRAPDRMRTVVVVSELRTNPRGREITSDFAGLADAAHTQLIPPACSAQAVRWYAHHGQFSTYDDCGPETFTELNLQWNGARYLHDAATERLLSREQAAELVQQLHLEPVEQLLDSWSWAALSTAGAEVPPPRG